jgi:hypothetical protein
MPFAPFRSPTFFPQSSRNIPGCPCYRSRLFTGNKSGEVAGMNAFVASGLIKRRVELAGDIEKANEALRCMVQDLENLDATIPSIRT